MMEHHFVNSPHSGHGSTAGLQPLLGGAQHHHPKVIAIVRAWLRERRRRQLPREAAKMADYIERAYFCR
jgi:hypothetical protein